jgi:hypothetical protein
MATQILTLPISGSFRRSLPQSLEILDRDEVSQGGEAYTLSRETVDRLSATNDEGARIVHAGKDMKLGGWEPPNKSEPIHPGFLSSVRDATVSLCALWENQ